MLRSLEYQYKYSNIMKNDQIIFDLIEKEDRRQRNGIELIASENFVSKEVMRQTN